LNCKLSWLFGKNILTFLAILVSFCKPQSAFAVESEPMPLPIVENGNLLYINHQGKVIIDPKVKTEADISKLESQAGQWTSIYNPNFIGSDLFFYDGLAAIKVNNKWGYINRSGKIVIQPFMLGRLPLAGPGRFSDGMSIIGEGKYTNRNGKLLNIKYDPINFIGNFYEGLLAVSLPYPGLEKYPSQVEAAYIDRSGRVVIKTGSNYHYFNDRGFDFSEGLVVTDGGYINKTGKIVIKCNDKKFNCLPFHEGLAAIYSKDTKKGGFINKQGSLAIPMKFDGGGLFCEGLSLMTLDEKIGVINRKGEFAIIEPKYKFDSLYDYARNDANLGVLGRFPCFSDGLVLIKVDKKVGFMDKKGKIVISPTFRNASSFVGGAAFVVTADNKWGWINKTGAFIWKSK
jgi:hypothetical protein